MTNSWAMLHDEMEEMRNRGYEMTADGMWVGREELIGEAASLEDNRSKEETRYLHSIPGMRESILEGMATPSEELAGEEELDWWGEDDRAATIQPTINSPSQKAIISKCDAVKSLLLEKNAAYGDSALEPVRIFSQATPVEQILVRLDDKLSRISRGGGIVGDDEDVIQDIIGYLILLQIALDRT